MSPLEICLLLNYHTPSSDGDMAYSPAVSDALDHFLSEGILRPVTAEELVDSQYVRSYAVTERGRALVDALCDVPYPVQTWVAPARPCAIGGVCGSASCLRHNSCDRL